MKKGTVLVINQYAVGLCTGYRAIEHYSSKKKACQMARKLQKKRFSVFGINPVGFLTVIKNDEIVLSLPLHDEEKRRGDKYVEKHTNK